MSCFLKILLFFLIYLNYCFCIDQTKLLNNFDSDLKKDINNNDANNKLSYDFQIISNVLNKLNYSDCVKNALIVLDSIKKQEKWALQMFDSSAKFPIGILYGNYYQLGNFDECVEIHKENYNIFGKYCLANIELLPKKDAGRASRSSKPFQVMSRHTFNNTIHWAICLPSQCKIFEISAIVKEIFTTTTGHQEISVKLDADKCHVNKSKPLSTLEIVYGSIIGVFLMFIFLTTVSHYYCLMKKKKSFAYNIETANQEKNKSIARQVFECFSIITTVKKFLHVSKNSENASLECICGIRVISMSFIVAGHSMLFIFSAPVQNTSFGEEETKRIQNAIFTNSPLLVDTFLLISGFLMCFMLLQEFDKRKGRINFLILYIVRYVRLTPAYLVILGFYCSFLYRSGSGPLWDSRIGLEQERCLTSWWANLLYINNYVSTDHMCMFQSWYLAVDYHLFIIAPFVIYPLWKRPQLGKLLLAALVIFSVFVPFWITYSQKLDPTLLSFFPELYDLVLNFYFKNAYIKTHMRASSYFIGLFFGYVVYKLKTNGTKIPKWFLTCGWITSSCCGLIALYSVVIFYYPTHQYNAIEAAIYAALHRVAWCISVGWILVACITENATIINKFLSWKFFIPLSRLTYCAYLINGFVEIVYVGTLRNGSYLSKYEMINKVVSHIMITFAGAFLLCVFFESPIHGLEKILLGIEKKRNKSGSTVTHQESNRTTL